MKKKVLTIVFLILLSFGCLIAFIIHTANRNLNAMDYEGQSFSQTIPHEYLGLFKENKNLDFKETINSKDKNPIVNCYYMKNNAMVIYKMGLIGDIPVDHMITEIRESRHITYSEVFWENAPFDVHFRVGKAEPFSRIFLTLYGSETKILKKNDSLAYYYSNLKNFSIGTKGEEPQDLFWSASDSISHPIEILFVKRQKYLYLFLLDRKKAYSEIDQYFLYNCAIKGKMYE
jgi:hypothetical protein